MVYLKSVVNVITLGKLIGLLFLFCLPLLSILFLKTKRNDLACPVMGTIFLVYIYIYHAKSRLNTPVWGSLRSPNYLLRESERSERSEHTVIGIGERSEPLSDKLGGEICIATRALVCIYLYNIYIICVRPDDRTVPTLYVACAARAK